MKHISVSVIIPAYNEEAIIKNAIDVAYRILQASGADFEVIVVNDGSTDKTAQILKDYFEGNEKIIVCHKPVNQGFGSAIRTGFEASTKQFIFCVPADSPMTTNLFDSFYINAYKADVLVSYRRKKVGYSLRRHINSWVYHWLISTLFFMNLRDYNWIHMYNRRIFDEGGIKIEYNGIFMLAEILIKARNRGFTFVEFEVEQTERLTGIATASKFSAILKTLGEIIHYRFRR
jgi:glycosyltransferase involved in cell wall biosynthesis